MHNQLVQAFFNQLIPAAIILVGGSIFLLCVSLARCARKNKHEWERNREALALYNRGVPLAMMEHDLAMRIAPGMVYDRKKKNLVPRASLSRYGIHKALAL